MATYGTINQIYVPGLDAQILASTTALSTSIAIPLIAANSWLISLLIAVRSFAPMVPLAP